MMVENEEFFKDLLRTKNILESYYFFKNIYDSDQKNEFAKCGFDNYVALREMLEKSCTYHIPVILGINTNTKIYNYKSGEYVYAKFKRCLCCGKLLPLEIDTGEEIDFSDNNDVDIIDYNYLNRKFFNVLDQFISTSKNYKNKEEAFANFKSIVNNEKNSLKKSIKK